MVSGVQRRRMRQRDLGTLDKLKAGKAFKDLGPLKLACHTGEGVDQMTSGNAPAPVGISALSRLAGWTSDT